MSFIECCGVVFDTDKIVALCKDQDDNKAFTVLTNNPVPQKFYYESVERRDDQFNKFLDLWKDSKNGSKK